MTKGYRNIHHLILVALLAAQLLVPATSLAQEGQRIEGNLVHKATGEPIIGAPVKLDGERFAVSS